MLYLRLLCCFSGFAFGFFFLTACSLQQDCLTNKDCLNPKAPLCKPQRDGTNRCSPMTTLCLSNSDCPFGKRCQAKQCRAKGELQCFPDCKPSEKCVQGRCKRVLRLGECDSECAVDEVCRDGKCAKKCQPSCEANELCKNGKCVQDSTGNCAPACARDEICINKKCERKQDAECRDNTDCAHGEKCTNARCVRSCSCTNNNECPTGKVCKDCQCITSPDIICPGIGEKCNPQAGAQACVAEATCLVVKEGDSKGLCFKNCRQDSSCDSGEVCVSRKRGQNTFNICLKDAKKGEACGLEKQIRCKSDEWTPLYCSTKDRKCATAVVRKKGESCNKPHDNTAPLKVCDRAMSLLCDEMSGICVQGIAVETLGKCELAQKRVCKHKEDFCFRFSNDVKHGYCVTRCALHAPQCPAGTRCVKGSGILQAYCRPYGTLKQDQVCDENQISTETYDSSKSCHREYSCVLLQPGARKGVCMKRFKSGCQGRCEKKQTCLGLKTGDGVCATNCSEKQSCRGTDIRCLAVRGGKFCGPVPESGPNHYAMKCGSPVKTKGCKAGLFCLPTEQNGDGFCSRDCSVDGKCPTAKDSTGKELSAQCVNVNQNTGQKACVFLCGVQGSVTCPGNLSCQKLQSGANVCL